MGRRLASKRKEVESEVLRKFRSIGIRASSYAQAGRTIEMSIHKTSSEEQFLIESEVKYIQ
jgi:hypothetical protein